MDPGTYNTRITRGSIWEFTFRYENADGTPKNLTGFSAQAQFQAAGTPWPANVMANASPALSSDGNIHVKIEEGVTDTIAWDEGKWRLVVTEPDGDPFPLLIGLVSVR